MKDPKQIDWNTAPEWANFYLIDNGGACWWFNKVPKIRKQEKLEIGWDFTGCKYQFVQWDIMESKNWKTSVNKRP